MTTKYESIFPTVVGFSTLEKKFTKTELNFINSQKNIVNKNIGNVSSSNNYILENKELKNLKQFCHDEINKYFVEIYQPKNELSLYITQSWLNFTEPGQFHHKHQHPNSFLSGTIYIECQEEDKIKFFKDGFEQFAIEPKNYNIYNSASWWFKAEKNNLIMFPSKLTHCVDQTISTNTRISLAFNTFFKGDLGDENNLTRLVL